MIDIHCHILPSVDDGARSWEMALAMCAMAREDGIEHIVATPHANDVYFYDRPAHHKLADELAQRFGNSLQISLGCDFHFSFENIQDALENPSRYTIDNTPYLLVEFSDYSIPPSVDDNLAKLINLGLKPIITHPERNPLVQRRPERVLEWVRGGCLVQVTGSALTGRWGKTAQSVAQWLFEAKAVHVLASDGHNVTSRKPTLKKAREAAAALAGETVAEALVTLNPRAIINGEPVPYCPSVP
ncbi:MAG TPA: CpsB/CapC family capsule biosynthesis tyrosine phosphatase [Terriglobales bacterium]|nr:CpsB/CapC family capsule biosynthesis tyrosine phosphatase [Terriglobales bacterium]